jgi:hypothetical protein
VPFDHVLQEVGCCYILNFMRRREENPVSLNNSFILIARRDNEMFNEAMFKAYKHQLKSR